MILTAHQPVYIPWLGLFHKIALAETFVSFNQVQYQTYDWNNRNKIKTANGPIWLSVPVKRKGRLNRIYSDIEIDYGQKWRRKHWTSILHAYKKAPHFVTYADQIEDLYKQEYRTLVELNEVMLHTFLDLLGIEVRFDYMNDYVLTGSKGELVLDMCRKLKTETFVFGAQGRDYADVDAFKQSGIECYFQEYQHPEYPQLHGEFVSHLSILDLLFNCGGDSLEILMSGNICRAELIERCKH